MSEVTGTVAHHETGDEHDDAVAQAIGTILAYARTQSKQLADAHDALLDAQEAYDPSATRIGEGPVDPVEQEIRLLEAEAQEETATDGMRWLAYDLGQVQSGNQEVIARYTAPAPDYAE